MPATYHSPMAPSKRSGILFDFFGTLVDYEADRTKLRYEQAHRVLCDHGLRLDHDTFVSEWETASVAVEARAASSLREPSMAEFVDEFARRAGLALDAQVSRDFLDAFLAEWVTGVRPIEGVRELLEDLGARHKLGIVSNTHDLHMVPMLLDQIGVSELIDHVVLSVDHGYRKPHRSIYEAAVGLIGTSPGETLFVGDSYDADYLGPRAVGVSALLIDPAGVHPIDPEHRLVSILDLPNML
jgi:putative hydrolase of the HAD superfamily